jgi:hypothetical protein
MIFLSDDDNNSFLTTKQLMVSYIQKIRKPYYEGLRSDLFKLSLRILDTVHSIFSKI